MIKIKIKENPDFIKNNLKYKNYSVLESIVLLDTAIDLLNNDFELSNNEIWELLKNYRINMKGVK